MAIRPALRPGAALLRRDGTHVQIGTSPGVVIRDRPGLLPFLRLLEGILDVPALERLTREVVPELTDSVLRLVTELFAAGAVIDASSRPKRHSQALSIAFEADEHSRPFIAMTRNVLTSAGLANVDATEPDLLIIASCGEAERSRFERATVLGIPHVVVAIDEERVRIGPFVDPGQTPCINCHDLHRTMWDPAWPALLHQVARPNSTASAAGLSPTTAHAAAVELAVEILAVADRQPIRTIGRCLLIGPGHNERASWEVPFHAQCACHLLSAA